MLACHLIFALPLLLQESSSEAPPHVETLVQPLIVSKAWTATAFEAAQREAAANAWSSGEVLTLALEAGDVDSVSLTGSLQGFDLQRVQNSAWWTLSLTIVDLETAAFGYDFARSKDKLALDPKLWADRHFRGPDALPAMASATELQGEIVSIELDRWANGDQRGVDYYLPPNYVIDNNTAVLYMADGQGTERYARYIEPLILDGSIEPLVIVGVHSGEGSMRQYEYLVNLEARGNPQNDPFVRHEKFFLDEVMTWAESELGVTEDPARRALFGTSNGADFVTSFGCRNPEVFDHVFALSIGMARGPVPKAKVKTHLWPTFHLTAGNLEPGFHKSTAGFAQRLTAAGIQSSFTTFTRGHDFSMWPEELARLIPKMFE